MTTRVIHIRDVPPGWPQSDEPTGEFVYIGRPGVFGNPYRLRRERDRDRLLRLYRRHLWCRIGKDAQFRRWVRMLAGSTLVCYCAPKPCHGDVLARAADWLADGGDPDPKRNCGLHTR